jgi:hypothetical protein
MSLKPFPESLPRTIPEYLETEQKALFVKIVDAMADARVPMRPTDSSQVGGLAATI